MTPALLENTSSQFGVVGHQMRLKGALFVKEFALDPLQPLLSLLGLFIELYEFPVLVYLSRGT